MHTNGSISKPQSAHTLTLFLISDPRREVISIYNDNFTTPESRVPYFIAVYRCVEADHNCPTKNKAYPVQSKKIKVEIVVPDLTNSDRDPYKNKFYKYVVYNHTSCKCGKLEERKLYKKIQDNKGRPKIRKRRLTNSFILCDQAIAG